MIWITLLPRATTRATEVTVSGQMRSPLTALTALAAAASLALHVLTTATTPTTAATTKSPHIVLILVDDWGYANVGYHRAPGFPETKTPNIDSLANTGVKLERFYTYKLCGPSRSSLQSGRIAMHVNYANNGHEYFNPADPVSGFASIPRNMTCVAEKLRDAGYRTVMTGKWDVGMATPRHMPMGRGYNESLFYYHHAVDYWTSGVEVAAIGEVNVCQNRFTDLWLNDRPATGIMDNGVYLEDVLRDHSVNAIKAHDPAQPLFLFHSFHLIHTPLQVPQRMINKFNFVEYGARGMYAAMVAYADEIVGDIVDALKTKKMWDDTILILHADNGGPIYTPGSANNFPLRGGKFNDFEGGVRVNALVNGGRLPPSRRGKTVTNVISIADWYSTFVHLANFGTGPAPADQVEKLSYDADAAGAGLPPIDSIDAWPVIAGLKTRGPRRVELQLSDQALLQGRYKLIVGNESNVMWTGPLYPNATGFQPFVPSGTNGPQDVSPFPPQTLATVDCGASGCLFDVVADPTEHAPINDAKIKQRMLARLADLNMNNFNPNRGKPSMIACNAAMKLYGGFYGPFAQLPKEQQAKLG